MANKLERANRRLEAILSRLDAAIGERNESLVETELKNISDQNIEADGLLYDKIVEKLNSINEGIIAEINDDDLEAGEIAQLMSISGKIENKMNPFKNTKDVIERLQTNLTTQELIDMQQNKKDSNDRDIEAYDAELKDKAKTKINMKSECIDKINKNKKRIDIFNKLKDVKKIYDSATIDPRLAPRKAKAKNTMIQCVNDLRSLGVMDPNLDTYETNPNYIADVIESNITSFKNDNYDIAKDYVSKNLNDFHQLDDGYGQIDTVLNSNDDILKAVEERYKELLEKITTLNSDMQILKTENREIDKNIDIMKTQENEVNMFAGRDPEDIMEDALRDSNIKKEAENRVNNQLTAKSKLGQKMEYYRKYEDKGRIKAFFKAIFSKHKNVKELAAATEGYWIVKDNHDRATTEIYRGKEEFRKSLRQTVAKERASGNVIDENRIKETAKKAAVNRRIEGR